MRKYLLEPNFIWHIRNFNKIHILKFKITVKFFTENLHSVCRGPMTDRPQFPSKTANQIIKYSFWCLVLITALQLAVGVCYFIKHVISVSSSLIKKKYIFFNLSINFSLYFTSQDRNARAI
jgi:hypothetical protein